MTTAIIGTITFTPIVFLYLFLIIGAPLGEYVLGGKHRTLPASSKSFFTTALAVQLILLLVLLQVGEIIPFLLAPPLVRGVGYFFALYLTYNTVISFASFNNKEKWFIAPLYLITAICFWMTLLIN